MTRFNDMGNPEKSLCYLCLDNGYCNVTEMVEQSKAFQETEPNFFELMKSSIEGSYVANSCPNVETRGQEVTENQMKPLEDFLQLHRLPNALQDKLLKLA